MKRGKEEEKKMGLPMFPRLHVNDADKGGGPRAPPRNKMALYEQLSIPSHRFSSKPLPLNHPNSTSNMVPSASSSQVNFINSSMWICFQTSWDVMDFQDFVCWSSVNYVFSDDVLYKDSIG